MVAGDNGKEPLIMLDLNSDEEGLNLDITPKDDQEGVYLFVGRVVVDKPFKVSLVLRMLRYAWDEYGKVHFTPFGTNEFLVSFSSLNMMHIVLKDGP